LKRLRVFLAVLILISGLLTGCVPVNDQERTPQSATGGVASDANNINLKDIEIAQQNDQTLITFSLLSGNRKAGYAESKLTQLPSYEVRLLDQPQRLMVAFSNISFWSYEEESTLVFSDFVLGLFKEVPADDNSLIIYVQLSRSASFDVSENEGTLTVTLTPGKENESAKYYCVSNSFYEHQEGRWPDNIDMRPVLCSDLQNKLLISKPFDAKEEAENYMQSIKGSLKEVLPNAGLSVITVSKNALPDYAADMAYSQVEGRHLLMKDDSYLETSVLLENGRYLTTAPDGRIAFSRRYKPEEPVLVQDNYLMSERLWILDTNGRAQSVDVSEFFEIDKATFSVDGRYIAILDRSIENTVLYVYDFTSRVLINLGEEGFGSQTSDFAWSDASNMLYAMTGNRDTKQMKACVFSDDGSFNIKAVEEQEGGEGHIAVWHGRLFFADSAVGKVYEIGETRREITNGVDIRVQPDSNHLLVLETKPSQDEQVLTSLKLYDIASGESIYIIQDSIIENFGFMKGDKVYYLDANVESPREGFPFGLYAYDVASGSLDTIALCSTNEFATSTSGMLYFIDYLGEGDNGFYATYTYDLNTK
jgi:hypothetical protein